MNKIFALIASLKELGYDANRKSEIARAVEDGIIDAKEAQMVSIYALVD